MDNFGTVQFYLPRLLLSSFYPFVAFRSVHLLCLISLFFTPPLSAAAVLFRRRCAVKMAVGDAITQPSPLAPSISALQIISRRKAVCLPPNMLHEVCNSLCSGGEPFVSEVN